MHLVHLRFYCDHHCSPSVTLCNLLLQLLIRSVMADFEYIPKLLRFEIPYIPNNHAYEWGLDLDIEVKRSALLEFTSLALWN